MALLASDRVGVTAGHDVEYALFVAGVGHRLGQPRIDVAKQEVDLVPLDQLQRLLHRDRGIAAR